MDADTMKNALAVVALMLTSGLATSCSGSDTTTPLLRDDAGDDGTTNCGGSSQPCCNGTACDDGLTCRSGSCSAQTETDAAVVADTGIAPDAGEDSAHDGAADAAGDATVDAGGDSGDGAAFDAAVTDAGNHDAAIADATSDVDAADASAVVDAGAADSCVADPACATASPYCSGGSAVVSCATDSNGCLMHTTKACAPHEACSGTAGAATCACANDPTCAQAGNVCVSSTSIEVCSTDSNGCLFVSTAPTTCTTNISNATADCSGNACGFVCVSGYSPCTGACVNEQIDTFNCGGCGTTCAGTCTGGRCLVTLASGQRDPYAVAVDSTSVYWGNYLSTGTSGTVMKCAVSGCGSNPTTLYVSPQGATSAIAVDGTNVYWTNNNYHASGPNLDTVMMMPVDGEPDGGAPTTLAPGQNGLYASQIAVDGKNVYWTNNGNKLQACAISGCGGGPTPLSAAFNYPLGMAVSAGNVFLANQGTILECATTGCAAPTPIYTASSATVGIGVDSAAVYWTTAAGAVMSRSLLSGTLATLAASTPGNTGAAVGTPFNIAVDATSVYWFTPSPDANGTNEAVMKVAKSGGAAVPLLAHQSLLQGIAVDSTSVYWTTGNGSVMKLTPK